MTTTRSAVFGLLGALWCWANLATGLCPFDRFVGASRCNSITAEGSAMVAALLWLLAQEDHLGATIFFDCSAPGGAASGSCTWQDDKQPSFMMRGLAMLIAANR